MDEVLKITFWVYVVGAIVFWVAGINLGYYTMGFVGTGILLFFVLEYYEGTAEDRRKQELEKRKIMLSKMTAEERKAFLEQDQIEKKLEQKEAEIRSLKAQLDTREKELSQTKAALRNAIQQSQQQSQQPAEVPLSAKLATSAVVGYKAGKTIAKW